MLVLFRYEALTELTLSVKGIAFLIETGFIASKSPQDISNFLLHTDGLSKAMIGEYLGEG